MRRVSSHAPIPDQRQEPVVGSHVTFNVYLLYDQHSPSFGDVDDLSHGEHYTPRIRLSL